MQSSHILKKKPAKTTAKTTSKTEEKKDTKEEAQPPKFEQNQRVPDFGGFEASILKILKDSKIPVRIDQIAKKTKMSKEFVFIWLCSTGKSIKNIKKVSFGVYTYDSSINLNTETNQTHKVSETTPLPKPKTRAKTKAKAKAKISPN